MLPKHKTSNSLSLFSRQKYFFPQDDPKQIEAWDKVITILFQEMKFHDLLEKHGIEGWLNDAWEIKFRRSNNMPFKIGPAYSRLMKALWDNFFPLFDEYGLCLKNHHTDEKVPMPIKH